MTVEGDEPTQFDWAGLVLNLVHPARVMIIEAMLWIEAPLSATDLVYVFDEEFTVSYLSYHVRQLHKQKVIRVVRSRRVRGASETFYFFRKPK